MFRSGGHIGDDYTPMTACPPPLKKDKNASQSLIMHTKLFLRVPFSFGYLFITYSVVKECNKKLFGTIQSGCCYYDIIQAQDRVLSTKVGQNLLIISIDQPANRLLNPNYKDK